MPVTVAAPGSLRMDKLFHSGLHLYYNLTMNLRLSEGRREEKQQFYSLVILFVHKKQFKLNHDG